MIAPILLFDWNLGDGVLSGLRPTVRLAAGGHVHRNLFARRDTMPWLDARADVSLVRGARADVRRIVWARFDTTFPVRADACTRDPLEASSIMSITSNLSWFRGEDVTLDFQMTPPVDVTGWTISLKVANTLGGTVQFTKSASITDGPRGRFRVTIASADTSSLAVGRYVWDCRRTDTGSKATLADGFIDLRQEITA